MFRYLIPIEFSGVGFKHFHIPVTLDNSPSPNESLETSGRADTKEANTQEACISVGDTVSISIRHGERFISLGNDHTTSKISHNQLPKIRKLRSDFLLLTASHISLLFKVAR